MFAYTIDSPDPRVRVEIHYDEDAMAPWDSCDMLASFAHTNQWEDHKSYGEDHGVSVYLSRYEEMGDTLAATIRELRFSGYTVIPFRIDDYGSSGTQVNECEPSDATSIAYVSAAKVASEGMTRRNVREGIRSELREVSAWANGDVYGFVILEATEDDDENGSGSGEDLDSCWGFIETDPSENYVDREALDMAKYHAAQMDAEATEARAMAARDIVTI